jgi:hypothetical protein
MIDRPALASTPDTNLSTTILRHVTCVTYIVADGGSRRGRHTGASSRALVCRTMRELCALGTVRWSRYGDRQ